jgi:anti-anti-sigma factor
MPEMPLDECIVTINAAPNGSWAHVRIAGDVDMAAAVVLETAALHLSRMSPRTVHFDLAGVTFADSMLPNFLARMRSAMPEGFSMVVCRPSGTVRRILQVSDMTRIAKIREEPPAEQARAPV